MLHKYLKYIVLNTKIKIKMYFIHNVQHEDGNKRSTLDL